MAFRPAGADKNDVGSGGWGGGGLWGQGSLVCGGLDGIMWLLDAAKAGRPKRLKGHGGAVRRLVFHSAVPTLLVSCSDDRSLRTWNTDTGQCLQVLLDG